MENKEIKFSKAESDLNGYGESWSGCSYEDKYSELSALVIDRKFRRPGHLQILVKELAFPVLDTTDMQTVREISEYVRKYLLMDCFQIAIDRKDSRGHLLLDNIDHLTGNSLPIPNSSQFKALCAYIYRKIGIDTVKDAGMLRYYITNEYRDNRYVFDLVRKEIAKKHLKKETLRFLSDNLDYMEFVCQGRCK